MPLSAYDLTFGLNSGRYFDNTPVYPGAGEFSQCLEFAGVTYGPARVSPAGAYISCLGGEEFFEQPSANFFYNHPNLRWKAADANSVAAIVNKVDAGYYQDDYLYVCRVNISSATRGAYTQVGKVYKDEIDYWTGDSEVTTMSGTYEVLTCLP